MTTTAPCGSWRSPVTPELITAGQTGLGGATLDGADLYWTETRASDAGRTSLWRQAADGTRAELTPEQNVRDMVHEYGGGGSWAVRDGVVVYSTHPDHTCWVLEPGGVRRQLTVGGDLRHAAFVVRPDLGIAVAVREDHRTGGEPANRLVALQLDTDDANADGGTVLATGADFYASPCLSDDGRLAWVEWDHPGMPWDEARLMVGELGPDLVVRHVRRVAGGAGSAACYPTWHGDRLLFCDDPDGYWNLFAERDGQVSPLLPATDPHDWCHPAWVPGAEYAVLDDGRILAHRFVDGSEQLGLLGEGTFRPLGDGSVAQSVRAGGGRVVGTFAYPDRPTELALLDVGTGEREVLQVSATLPDDVAACVSAATAVSWDGPEGPVHALYYAPRNPDVEAPVGELPPLLVLSHGGPTSMASPALDLRKQYWTSRGWAVLDVNYGGSSGYGRAYRDRLRGQWGVVDVRDCVEGARAMVAQGLAAPDRLAIEGGSAGGFTTLAALTTSDVFAAGHCKYGIADLTVLAADTHKFESRYTDGLLGGSPAEVPQVYVDRSPIHHLDRLACPMLIQQGLDDKVVPPNQSVLMADAVRAKGLPVALVMYEGEGHGFRRAETIKASLEAANSFFGQVFGYTPVDVPPIEIENL